MSDRLQTATQIRVPIVVRDLIAADIDNLRWSGGPSHIAAIREQFARCAAGAADYLVACTPVGRPVGKAGIDYERPDGSGLIHQVAVHGALQSCGIGTLLMQSAEDRIRGRGLDRAELAVEHSNPRARTLYERLGYVACGDEEDEWDEDQPDGTVTRYRTMCSVMRKVLR